MLKKRNVAAMLGVMVFSLSSLLADTDMNVKVNGCKGPILCSNYPILSDCEECCHTWHLDAGLLYQQPGFYGMQAGVAQEPEITHHTGGLFQNQTVTELTQCFDYDAGLTVSIGHMSTHDHWVFGARFDWLSTSTGNKVYEELNTDYLINQNFDAGVLTGASTDGLNQVYTKIKYGADIDFYNLDLMLSRGAFISRCYSLEPFAGIKALWFDANQSGTYYNTTTFSSGSTPIYKELRSIWGVGPMFGLNGEYYLTHGFAIFSDSDVAVLYGEATRKRTSILTRGDVPNERNITSNKKYSCQYYVPVRTVLGVKLFRYCLEDAHYLAVKVGYDARAILSAADVDSGFVMNGLYLNFIWDF